MMIQDPAQYIVYSNDLGADAVIGVRYATSMVMAGASEMLAYGTAVKLQ